MFILCECNWDIPRVEKLPPHMHVMMSHNVSPHFDGWVPNVAGGIEQREELHFSIDWRAYSRAIEFAVAKRPAARADTGVGSPAHLKLDQWGYLLKCAFGETAYVVGSSTESKQWRDVDVRMIFDDDDWMRWIGRIEVGHRMIAPWHVLCTALSVWGREFTGLPIDFQFQRRDEVTDTDWAKIREPLGLGFYGIHVYTKEDRERDPDYVALTAASALVERLACAHDFDPECSRCELMTPLRKAMEEASV